ncbi:MAG: isocitrate dehydrogenase (NADP(+)), partial [Acidithiobacillus ferrivorans]
NGDYISDALAAEVGGIGMAPGANLSDTHAIFEATHGTAPDIAGQGKANPSSLILSAVMMLEHLGWGEAATRIVVAMNAAIASGEVTGDLAALRGDVPALSTAEFSAALVRRL